jgi:hypothetical protein
MVARGLLIHTTTECACYCNVKIVSKSIEEYLQTKVSQRIILLFTLIYYTHDTG